MDATYSNDKRGYSGGSGGGVNGASRGQQGHHQVGHHQQGGHQGHLGGGHRQSGRHQVSPKKPGLLKHQVHLTKYRTPDGQERFTIEPIEETLSFEKGFFLFIRAVQQIAKHNKEGVVLVGLAGPSGAGKTVFSEKIASFLPGICMISMDMYNDASRLIDGNFDDPRLTDYDLLMENIQGLRTGNAVEVPIYDFKTSTRTGVRRVEVPESRVVVIEGIYALSERLRPLLDLRVSITGGVHFDLVKRVLRDINRSAQDPEDIIHQISETVYPMYKAFIEPDLATAHLKIVNKFNPFSGFQNATYILKSHVEVNEEQIRAVLTPGHTETQEETYDIYLLPPGEDRDTCQSYLRMRNRDGRYSLMFEEWVTDDPFIISPRIVFEVSVRLLGGLMALGYEIATILKRVSRVFFDEELRVTVKIDKLEQLHRCYVQVQGKDRPSIRQVARKLGMEGHYLPRSYIEQIQLEKLTQEVQGVPQELKERFGEIEEMVASPRFGSSVPFSDPGGASARNFFNKSKSWTHEQQKREISSSAPTWRPLASPLTRRASRGGEGGEEEEYEEEEEEQRLMIHEDSATIGWGPAHTQRRSIRRSRALEPPDSPPHARESSQRVFEQLQGVNERLDELLSRVSDLEVRVSEMPAGVAALRTVTGQLANGHAPATAAYGATSAPIPVTGSWGSQSQHSLLVGPTAAQGSAHGSSGTSPDRKDVAGQLESSLAEEVKHLNRSQRHITAQLEEMSTLLRDVTASGKSSSMRSVHSSLQEHSPADTWRDYLMGSVGAAPPTLAAATGVVVVGAVLASAVAVMRRQQS